MRQHITIILNYRLYKRSYCKKKSLDTNFFFFSSRRRHTRSLRDWSSDVCSSDLVRLGLRALARHGGRRAEPAAAAAGHSRSEERRVGKECRCWWVAFH